MYKAKDFSQRYSVGTLFNEGRDRLLLTAHPMIGAYSAGLWSASSSASFVPLYSYSPTPAGLASGPFRAGSGAGNGINGVANGVAGGVGNGVTGAVELTASPVISNRKKTEKVEREMIETAVVDTSHGSDESATATAEAIASEPTHDSPDPHSVNGEEKEEREEEDRKDGKREKEEKEGREETQGHEAVTSSSSVRLKGTHERERVDRLFRGRWVRILSLSVRIFARTVDSRFKNA